MRSESQNKATKDFQSMFFSCLLNHRCMFVCVLISEILCVWTCREADRRGDGFGFTWVLWCLCTLGGSELGFHVCIVSEPAASLTRRTISFLCVPSSLASYSLKALSFSVKSRRKRQRLIIHVARWTGFVIVRFHSRNGPYLIPDSSHSIVDCTLHS